jgi:hypothetical protein
MCGCADVQMCGCANVRMCKNISWDEFDLGLCRDKACLVSTGAIDPYGLYDPYDPFDPI